MINFNSENVILLNVLLTLSSVGSGWTGWDEGSGTGWDHCHIVCPGVENHQKDHLWSLDNQSIGRNRYPCWEISSGWQCQWAVRWCRCSLYVLGRYLGRMVKTCVHLHQWIHRHMNLSKQEEKFFRWTVASTVNSCIISITRRIKLPSLDLLASPQVEIHKYWITGNLLARFDYFTNNIKNYLWHK